MKNGRRVPGNVSRLGLWRARRFICMAPSTRTRKTRPVRRNDRGNVALRLWFSQRYSTCLLTCPFGDRWISFTRVMRVAYIRLDLSDVTSFRIHINTVTRATFCEFIYVYVRNNILFPDRNEYQQLLQLWVSVFYKMFPLPAAGYFYLYLSNNYFTPCVKANWFPFEQNTMRVFIRILRCYDILLNEQNCRWKGNSNW